MLQDVTLGSSPEGQAGAPRIGRGVLLSAGATVLGNIEIGDFAKIGAGSLVVASVPSGYTAVGVPARLVGRKPEARPGLNMVSSPPRPACNLGAGGFGGGAAALHVPAGLGQEYPV